MARGDKIWKTWRQIVQEDHVKRNIRQKVITLRDAPKNIAHLNKYFSDTNAGDRLKYLLNTKVEYAIYLIKQLVDTSSKEAKQKCHLLLPFVTPSMNEKKKKLNQRKYDLDQNMSEMCQTFQEQMKKVGILYPYLSIAADTTACPFERYLL